MRSCAVRCPSLHHLRFHSFSPLIVSSPSSFSLSQLSSRSRRSSCIPLTITSGATPTFHTARCISLNPSSQDIFDYVSEEFELC
jgi:hypothetical protein